MAPALELTEGLPQDSICMIVATRLGSRAEAFDQRVISFAQYWISRVKMREMVVEVEIKFDGEAAAVLIGVLSARAVMRQVINNTERMDSE